MIQLTPLHNTRAYKDIVEEATPKIMLQLLQKQLADGSISQETYDTYISGLNGQHT